MPSIESGRADPRRTSGPRGVTDGAGAPAAAAAMHAVAATHIRLAATRRAEPFTCELRFPGLRVPLDEFLERLLRGVGLAELLLAEGPLPETARHLVPVREPGLDLRVLGGRAVELRLSEDRKSV